MNENYFQNLDITATKEKSKNINDHDPVLGNVRKLVTEKFVRDGFLSLTKNSKSNRKEYELGGKAFYYFDKQSIVSFGLKTCEKREISREDWNKLAGIP